MTVGHSSPPKVVSRTISWTAPPVARSFSSSPPPSSSPGSSPSYRVVLEPFTALPKCRWENPLPCRPRHSLPTHSLATATRQSPRTTPLFSQTAQVQYLPLIPSNRLVTLANGLFRMGRMPPSCLLSPDPPQPPSPHPLSIPIPFPTAHGLIRHSAHSIALPQKMPPPSPTPNPVREAR